MSFEKIKNLYKKYVEIGKYYYKNNPLGVMLISTFLHAQFFIGVTYGVVKCLDFFSIPMIRIMYIIVILLILIYIAWSLPLTGFILQVIEKHIKIKNIFLENKILNEINEINKYYYQNKSLTREFILGASFYGILALFFFSPNFLPSLFDFITFILYKYKSIVFIIMIFVALPMCVLPLFVVIEYFLTGFILLKADKFIKRNKSQPELKELKEEIYYE